MGKLIFTKLNHPADQCFTCGNPSIDKKVADSYFLTLLDRCYAYEVTTESGVIVAYYQIQFKRFPIDRFLSRLMSILLIVMWTFMQCILSILLFVKNISIKR